MKKAEERSIKAEERRSIQIKRASEKSKKASERKRSIEERKRSIEERKRSIEERKRSNEERKRSLKEQRASIKNEEKLRKAEEKLRKAEERKQAAEFKKSIKLAAVASSASSSSRRTRKVKINPIASNRISLHVVNINGVPSPAITKGEFNKNLTELGVFDDYCYLVKQLNKKCLVKDLDQLGGGLGGGVMTNWILTKIGIYSLFAGAWGVFNFNALNVAYDNYTQLTDSYLLDDNMFWTNVGLNILGIGVPPECKGGLSTILFSHLFTGVSLASVYTMGVLFAENYENTIGWFANYASDVFTNFRTDEYIE